MKLGPAQVERNPGTGRGVQPRHHERPAREVRAAEETSRYAPQTQERGLATKAPAKPTVCSPVVTPGHRVRERLP